jgi:glucosamine-6-phosphate deaminase
VKVLILDGAEAAAERVAEIVAARLGSAPGAVLGLATGETMRPVYARLVALHREGRADFAGAATFNLDEYVGVGPGHPASFAAFMRETLFDHVNLDPARCRLPRGDAADPEAEARAYEAAIAAAGGIDLQVLGIGRNGHLAFNEPTSSLASRTRIKTLTEATRRANAPAFAPDPVPRHAITMGIATILEARACVLLATGRRRRRPWRGWWRGRWARTARPRRFRCIRRRRWCWMPRRRGGSRCVSITRPSIRAGRRRVLG